MLYELFDKKGFQIKNSDKLWDNFIPFPVGNKLNMHEWLTH